MVLPMKTRLTNLLTATLWLLIVAVWVPTFWVLVQLPGTFPLLSYVEGVLGTASYPCPVNDYFDHFFCETPVTSAGDWFVPLKKGLEDNGGPDGTRTRDLRRDRPAF